MNNFETGAPIASPAHFVMKRGRRLSIIEDGQLWQIARGRAEVYYELQNEHGGATRALLFSLEQGDLYAAYSGTKASVFIAAFSDVDVNILVDSDGATSPGVNLELVVESFEEYVKRLGSRFLNDQSIQSSLQFEIGTIVTATGPDTTIGSVNQVAWARQIVDGSERTSDSKGDSSDPSPELIPLYRGLVLAASPGTKWELIDTSQLVSRYGLSAGGEALHRRTEQLMVREAAAQAREDEAMILRKRESVVDAMTTALVTLGSIATDGSSVQARLPPSGNPHLVAFTAAAEKLGVQILDSIQLSVDDQQTSPFEQIAAATRFEIRRVTLSGQWWHRLATPLVSHYGSEAMPIALWPGRNGVAVLFDGKSRKTVKVTQHVADQIALNAFMLYRTLPTRPIHAARMIGFGLTGCVAEIFTVGALGVMGGIVALILPVTTGVIFDEVIPGAESHQLSILTFALIASVFARICFYAANGLVLVRLQAKIEIALQAAIWHRLLYLPADFFRRYSSGDLAQRALGISQMRELVTGAIINSLLGGIFSLFSGGLLFYYSARLAWVAMGLVLLAAAVTLCAGGFELRFRRMVSHGYGAVTSILVEILRGITKIQSSGNETRALARWSRAYSAQRRSVQKAEAIVAISTVFTASYVSIAMAVVYIANARLGSSPSSPVLSPGPLLAFLVAFTQLLGGILSLSDSVIKAAGVLPLYERLKPILVTQPELQERKGRTHKLAGAIEFSNVNFAYPPKDKAVLRQLSFFVRPGESVAIVGSSGCGKSTLLRLLLGFETPQSGAVYFDGRDLKTLDRVEIRRQIGVVLQTTRLLNGSLLENIIGASRLTVDEAWQACIQAGIADDISRMPMGLHTILSEGGGGLSGGQRQRIMIARAIVRKPRILLFDEATSALDNKSQKIVMDSINSLQATRIVIAHRLTTLVNMDRIIVMEQGTISDIGTFDNLISRDGLFRRLVERQMQPRYA